MKRVLAIFATLMMAMFVMADTEIVDGIEWTYTVSDGKASVGSGSYVGACAVPTSTTGAIAIPSTLGGYPVTSIGYHAFYACSGLTSVTISEGVTSIGGYAFWGCCGMTNITIPNSVTSIDDHGFYGCSGLTSITIPEGVTLIGSWAFSGCIKLTSVTIPEGVASIGNGVFAYCGNLASITIPSSMTSIGISAFLGCGLTIVTIPSSVTNIGQYAIAYCDMLESVVFEGAPPSGVAEAGIKQDVAIRYNVAYHDEWQPVIAECGFTNASPYFPDGGPYSEVVDGIEWTFMVKNGEARVGSNDQADSTAVTNTISGTVVIPSVLGEHPVTSIGYAAFSHCTNMTSITIPASVNEIGSVALASCEKLTNIYFEGNTIGKIGLHTFHGCNWDLIMHVPTTWQGRGRTICGYSVWKGDDPNETVRVVSTNVVVHYMTTNAPVEVVAPISADTGIVNVMTEVKGGNVAIPDSWAKGFPSFETKFGSNFTDALTKQTGKYDCNKTPMLVWQDYVAGTDPTNPNDTFTATITMVEGMPQVQWKPVLTDEAAAKRVYRKFGKVKLTDEWAEIPSGREADYNFFKVTVEMK